MLEIEQLISVKCSTTIKITWDNRTDNRFCWEVVLNIVITGLKIKGQITENSNFKTEIQDTLISRSQILDAFKKIATYKNSMNYILHGSKLRTCKLTRYWVRNVVITLYCRVYIGLGHKFSVIAFILNNWKEGQLRKALLILQAILLCVIIY